MAKEKLTLGDLKVQSFVTTLGDEQMNKVKGGFVMMSGRRYAYKTRWTLVDTRSDVINDVVSVTGR